MYIYIYIQYIYIYIYIYLWLQCWDLMPYFWNYMEACWSHFRAQHGLLVCQFRGPVCLNSTEIP